MIYFVSEAGQSFLILEPTNLDSLQKGKPVISPDKKIIIAYTPDIAWLESKMRTQFASKEIIVKELDDLLTESQKRAEVRR